MFNQVLVVIFEDHIHVFSSLSIHMYIKLHTTRFIRGWQKIQIVINFSTRFVIIITICNFITKRVVTWHWIILKLIAHTRQFKPKPFISLIPCMIQWGDKHKFKYNQAGTSNISIQHLLPSLTVPDILLGKICRTLYRLYEATFQLYWWKKKHLRCPSVYYFRHERASE